jgi:hypothetical protein
VVDEQRGIGLSLNEPNIEKVSSEAAVPGPWSLFQAIERSSQVTDEAWTNWVLEPRRLKEGILDIELVDGPLL